MYVPALEEAQTRKSFLEDHIGATRGGNRCFNSAMHQYRQIRIALHSNLAWHDIAEYEHRTRHQPRHRAPPAGTALINSGLSSANHLLKRVPVVVRWIFMDSAQSQFVLARGAANRDKQSYSLQEPPAIHFYPQRLSTTHVPSQDNHAAGVREVSERTVCLVFHSQVTGHCTNPSCNCSTSTYY